MEDVIRKRYNRLKRKYRIHLGMTQFTLNPILNVIWLPIILAAMGIIWGKEAAITYLLSDSDAHEIFYPILNSLIIFFTIMLLYLIVFSIFEKVGEYSAKWSESCLVVAFSAKDLRNGHPILINKYIVKGTGVMVYEFYSPIPYKTWVEKQDAIADAMNIHFVEEIKYGGTQNNDGRKIVITVAKGRKNTEQGTLYDEEL